MPWSYAGSRFAVILRQVRGRFGISAPQLAVRAHVSWRLRAFVSFVIFALLLVLVFWVFDFGQQIAGFNRNEIKALQTRIGVLEEDVSRLRGLLTASENDLQIERSAQKLLAERQKSLIEENTRLKEALAVLERLSRAKK